MKKTKISRFAFTLCLLLIPRLHAQTESLPPLNNGLSPQTLDEAWAGYDPTVEPLEVEVFKEWEEEGAVMRGVRYCIGTFKGQKSWMGAFYGFPQGGENLPGLVQIHGGGGVASTDACVQNAKRGYAIISLNWRADKRFIKKADLPEGAQTDWGAVDGTQSAGSRGIEPNNDKRYDPVPSARNGGYFLRVLAARRALTFLAQQPEVDGDQLGVYGHSMGGVIALETAAIDSRVKAAAPSCAPPIDLEDTLIARTYAPSAYAAKFHCPMLFMSPANDFHGRVEDMEWIMGQSPRKDFRIARSEHYNHKHNASCLAANELWFDAHLKNALSFPVRPEIAVDLPKDGRPSVRVTPDDSWPIDHVDIFYTRDARSTEYATVKTRFWQCVATAEEGDDYVAEIDLFESKQALWVFANVHYELQPDDTDAPLTHPSDTLTSTTRMKLLTDEQLRNSGVKTDSRTTSVIESFGADWRKEWILSGTRLESWRLNDARVSMPSYGKLALDVQSNQPNHLRVNIGDYIGVFPLAGGAALQRVEVYPFDLQHKDTQARLLNWPMLVRPSMSLSSESSKALPRYQKLFWENISVEEFTAKRPFQLGEAGRDNGKTMLTFADADQIIGRIDVDKKSVKTNFEQGLQVHSHSEVTYFLKGDFTTFTATIVPCHQASVTFEVHTDGKRVFESERMTGRSAPKDIEVDVSGARELKLIVTEGGNGWAGDWVMWANASIEHSSEVKK